MFAKNTLPEIIRSKNKQKAVLFFARKKLPKRSPVTITEQYTPGCIGHAAKLVNLGQGNSIFVVQDFLVDSSGLSRGGESINPIVQVGLNASKKIVFSILPEACKKSFRVSKPSGVNQGHFAISFGRVALRRAAGGSGFYDAYPSSIVFNNLSGTQPSITYANFFISGGVNNSFYVYVTGEFSKNFSFTDIQIECNYPSRNFLPEFGSYELLSYSMPFTIPAQNDVCYAMFGYNSPTETDLGPIIEII